MDKCQFLQKSEKVISDFADSLTVGKVIRTNFDFNFHVAQQTIRAATCSGVGDYISQRKYGRKPDSIEMLQKVYKSSEGLTYIRVSYHVIKDILRGSM
ncbi:hypothetical protein ACTXT7_016746 [Hymenolepis weldensis]